MFYKITNDDFISAIFKDDSSLCHVTDFAYDPGCIPKGEHLRCWAGGYYRDYRLSERTNQYFTISVFHPDENGIARRRKALFKHTRCIVLDDVREKLSITEVEKLPSPSWILETSPGSEQWGYILDVPCSDRARVENLLDGLVANGLAPDGKDPGMKGVTRYVRLPGGVNSKASKLVDGKPFECRMLRWEPSHTVAMEDIAAPFSVDLDAVRREQRVDGAAVVSDHPLLQIPDIVHIKEVRSDGRFDITCPWVEEHTGADDSGAAIFTNADYSLGFKCHHGACQDRTGKDLVEYVETRSPGFESELKLAQFKHGVGEASRALANTPPVAPSVDFMSASEQPAAEESLDSLMSRQCDELRRHIPGSTEQRALATQLLKVIDKLPAVDRKHMHDTVADIMRWSKADLKSIIKSLREDWYAKSVANADFCDEVIFVKELNKFYSRKTRIFFTPEAFQNAHCHEDADARTTALVEGRVKKVDRLDYAPKQPDMFTHGGVVYGNAWYDCDHEPGEPGDVSWWAEHFDILGWGDSRAHIEKWMAYTLRYPENKINHMLLLGSTEGCGKDYLLYPLAAAMGDNHITISGDELLSDFNDYLMSTKYLHINETELGDHKEARLISNRLKPLASTPPDKLRINQKSIARVQIRNIVNCSMTTNSLLPLRLSGTSRRFYALWSDLNTRDKNDEMKPEWVRYWNERWEWMKSGGWKHVVHYLIHCVDLSDFNPYSPPPMTEFLREIKDFSKSPMHQTLENFATKKHGAFKCDLLTIKDMGATLRAGGMFPEDMTVDPKYFTDRKISMLIREMQCFVQMRSRSTRIYVIRDEEKYVYMSPTEIQSEYESQIKNLKSSTSLTVVHDNTVHDKPTEKRSEPDVNFF